MNYIGGNFTAALGLVLCYSALLAGVQAGATWTEEPLFSAEQLAQAILDPQDALDLQLVPNSATFVGAFERAAKFTNGPNSLSTGLLLQTPTGAPQDAATGSALCNVLGRQTYGATVLSFSLNVQPVSKTVSFDYVFASRESDTFFNDVLVVYIDAALRVNMTVSKAASLNLTIDPGFADDPRAFRFYTPAQSTTISLSAGVHTMQLAVCNVGDAQLNSGAFFARLRGTPFDLEAEALAKRLIVPNTGLDVVSGSASKQENAGSGAKAFTDGPSGIASGVLMFTSDSAAGGLGTGSILCSDALNRPGSDTRGASILSFDLTVAAGFGSLSLDYVFATRETQLGSLPDFNDVVVVYMDGKLVGKFSLSDVNFNSILQTPGQGFGHGFDSFTELNSFIFSANAGVRKMQIAACNVFDNTVKSGGFVASLRGSSPSGSVCKADCVIKAVARETSHADVSAGGKCVSLQFDDV